MRNRQISSLSMSLKLICKKKARLPIDKIDEKTINRQNLGLNRRALFPMAAQCRGYMSDARVSQPG